MGWSPARALKAVWTAQSEYLSRSSSLCLYLGEAWALERIESLKCVQMVVRFAPLMRLKALFVLTVAHDLLLRGHPVPTGPCPFFLWELA